MPEQESKFGFHVPPNRLQALCGELVHEPETHTIPTDEQSSAVVGVSDTEHVFKTLFHVPPKVTQALDGGFGTVIPPGVLHNPPDQVPPMTVQASWFPGSEPVIPIRVQAPALVDHVPFKDKHNVSAIPSEVEEVEENAHGGVLAVFHVPASALQIA